MLKVEEPKKARKMSTTSIKASEQSEIHKISLSKREEEVEVSCKSYFSYIFFNKLNYFLFPLTILVFLIA